MDHSDTGSVGTFYKASSHLLRGDLVALEDDVDFGTQAQHAWTNRTQKARYILTKDQSAAGNAGIYLLRSE
eukprot:984433-Prorocentrum_minimum.AAC.2